MHTFRVWAPLPKKVEVQVGAERHPMAAQPDGWWSAEIPPPNSGDGYGFILDGEGPFPDPRSPSQPAGVHHLSQLTDPDSYGWEDDTGSRPRSPQPSFMNCTSALSRRRELLFRRLKSWIIWSRLV